MTWNTSENDTAAMNAVLLYNQFDLAASAKISLEHATSRAGGDVRWNVHPWQLDWLEQHANAQEAMDEAVEADLILLITGTQRAAPPWLKDWLSRWAVMRRVPDAALGVLFVASQDGAAPPLVAELKDCAQRYGLNFISNLDSRAHAGTPATTRSSRRRTAWMRPMLQQLARNSSAPRVQIANRYN